MSVIALKNMKYVTPLSSVIFFYLNLLYLLSGINC